MPNLSDLAGYGRDFLQGASNAAASNISAPVDGLAWLLNKGGMNIQNPVGGSDWMAQQGLTQQPQNRLAGLLGESVGGVAPMLAAAKAPQIASGVNTMINNGLTQRSMNPQTGAVVWHGSPHTFDKFDASKIGTGEGAQAYGNGLYVADSQSVAGNYQKALAGSEHGPAGQTAANMLRMYKTPESAVSALASDFSPTMTVEARKHTQDAIDLLQSGKANTGSLYKVDLPDEHIAKMLDWDKSINSQPENIKSLFSNNATRKQLNAGGVETMPVSFNGKITHEFSNGFSGQDLYETLSNNLGADEASRLLQQHGATGVRYLDGGSRATGGTSNYVVFPGNEHMLTITQRNGQNIK